MIPWLEGSMAFPDVGHAMREPNGLLAAGGDLEPERLLSAYRRGIFPWYGQGEPILWWSPDPRMVLVPGEFRLPRSLAKRLRRSDYEVRADSAFYDVIAGCAQPRDGAAGTWITPEMQAAYCRLHVLGHAHSFETWIGGQLAGGLYGVAIGRAFFGESMFTRVSDASKIALVHLVFQLRRWGYGLIDCQMNTAHLARFGAREIPRTLFSQQLAELVNYPTTSPAPWRVDDDLLN
jgi:leucyl/phenylalanyl-tRNA--protein transferase